MKQPFLSKRYGNGQVRIEVKLDKQRHTCTVSEALYEQLCAQYALDHNPANFLLSAKYALLKQFEENIKAIEDQVRSMQG